MIDLNVKKDYDGLYRVNAVTVVDGVMQPAQLIVSTRDRVTRLSCEDVANLTGRKIETVRRFIRSSKQVMVENELVVPCKMRGVSFDGDTERDLYFILNGGHNIKSVIGMDIIGNSDFSIKNSVLLIEYCNEDAYLSDFRERTRNSEPIDILANIGEDRAAVNIDMLLADIANNK